MRNLSLLKKILHALGLDRAIAFTVLARAFQIVGSAGTVLLIVRFLSPTEQGYYYTLLSLVALSTIFELGFSFVILQLAAHEFARLRVHLDGSVTGDSIAHARLASILQTSVRWYSRIAVLMGVILLPLGPLFFSRQTNGGVAWKAPWVLAVVACAGAFSLNPLIAFLEGCGQVQEVARMRFEQAIASTSLAWTAMICHRGLYSPGLVLVGYALVTFVFLWRRRSFLLRLFRYSVPSGGIAWRTEVWSFQWRIAITWLCSYFTVQCFTPILFIFRGPVDAGRMGMSTSIVAYLSNVVLPWMSTKAAPFGRMIASGQFDKLDHLFFRTLRQSLLLLLLIVIGLITVLLGFQHLLPKVTSRLVPIWAFVLLLMGAVSTYIIQSLAIYLRAHKSEPLLLQFLVVAGTTFIGTLLCVPMSGTTGAAAIYFIASGVLGLPWAIRVFRLSRDRWRAQRIEEFSSLSEDGHQASLEIMV